MSAPWVHGGSEPPTLKGLHNRRFYEDLPVFVLWNPFRVLPIRMNHYPGWRGFAAYPGLCCETPLEYTPCGNHTYFAKLRTTDPVYPDHPCKKCIANQHVVLRLKGRAEWQRIKKRNNRMRRSDFWGSDFGLLTESCDTSPLVDSPRSPWPPR